MTKKEKIIKYKTSINKIKASTLKEIGFKSKTIAQKFAKLTDVNPKEYSNEELLLTALKNKLSMFQKLGLKFNSLMIISLTSAPDFNAPFLYASDNPKLKLSLSGCPLIINILFILISCSVVNKSAYE